MMNIRWYHITKPDMDTLQTVHPHQLVMWWAVCSPRISSVLNDVNHLHYHHMALQPSSGLEDQASVFITPGDRVTPLTPPPPPRHWVPILVAFNDIHALQWDYSLFTATTRGNDVNT
jgi:hypothetical protein